MRAVEDIRAAIPYVLAFGEGRPHEADLMQRLSDHADSLEAALAQPGDGPLAITEDGTVVRMERVPAIAAGDLRVTPPPMWRFPEVSRVHIEPAAQSTTVEPPASPADLRMALEAEDLRAAAADLVAALVRAPIGWHVDENGKCWQLEAPGGAHADHRYDGGCAICRCGDQPDALLAVCEAAICHLRSMEREAE